MELTALTEAEFRRNPVLFVELAHAWSATGTPPDPRREEWLRELPHPLLPHPALAREALWGALSYPERARSLSWLDQTGLLAELIPAWAGRAERRAFRLAAVDEVHLERWAGGLGSIPYEWLCVFEDQRMGRLGGWALTGLATLLLEGDEPTAAFTAHIERDVKALGAIPMEIDRLLPVIREYPDLKEVLLTGRTSARSFSPISIVATLCSLMVMPELAMSTLRGVIQTAGGLLMRYAAPGSPDDRTAM